MRIPKIRRIIGASFPVIVSAFLLNVALTAPSNDRNWKPEFSVLPDIERNGDRVTIRGLRDWRYDGNGPTALRWTERTVRLDDVERVWFVMEPFEKWDAIAHTFLIFDFRDGDPLVLSVEARGEVGEEFNPVMGTLRSYELMYIWGTERDLLVRRAVFLGNRLYMYPLRVSDGFPRRLLSDLLRTTDDIVRNPRFYDTLTDNCTNVLARSANEATPESVPWDKSFIFPGYSAEFLFRHGYIRSGTDPKTDKEHFRIDDIVRDIRTSERFSDELRGRLPTD